MITMSFFAVGKIIAERWRIQYLADRGGMGMVFKALDLETQREVALKVLPIGMLSERASARFLRECQTLSALSHPNIVSYVAHGEVTPGQPYLAMEWLEGESLAHRLARQPLTLEETLTLLHPVAQALSAAHARGIVHRDLKPSNIFLRDGKLDAATLIDFGIAHGVLGRAAYRLTNPGALLGSPDYLSPEQARGLQDISPSADIFSLGCVVYQCLAGHTPFAGGHTAALLTKILFEEPTSLQQFVAIPDHLDALVLRMLRKDPLQRPQNAADLLAELSQQPQLQVVRATEDSAAPECLTTDEQRLVSVVLAVTSAPMSDTTERKHDVAIAEVRESLAGFGISSDALADGTLLATVVQESSSSAPEQAETAARCALLVKRSLPDSVVSLATGRTEIAQQPRTGETASRAWRIGNAAIRKQSVLDGVLCDENTAMLIETRFQLAKQADDCFLLVGERQQETAAEPRIGTQLSFRGRDMELASLDVSLSASIEGPQARAVLVTAPPGIGKSRLQREFVKRVQNRCEDVCILQGRADFVSAGSIYAPLSRALRRLCGLTSEHLVSEQRALLVKRLGQHLPNDSRDRILEFLGEICSIQLVEDPSPKLRAARSDPKIMSTQVCQAWVDFLWAETEQHPILLVLEDLHWGDALSVTLVDSALRDLADRPLLVLGLARPEVEESFPKLWSERGLHHIRLSPLSRRVCELLAKEALGSSVSEVLIKRAAALSGGNPLCLEESIRAVAEGHGDEPSNAVLAMLQARLLRLSANTRRVLRAASLFGEQFSADGVCHLLGVSQPSPIIDQEIRKLIQAELIEPAASESQGRGAEYQFRHALMRDAAYSLLTVDDRTVGHRLVGRYLESHGEQNPLLLAEHFQRGNVPAAAALYLLRAAERALLVSDFEQALRLSEQGVKCDPNPDILGSLRAVQLAANFWRDGWTAALPVGQQAIELLPVGSEDWCKAAALLLPISSLTGNRALFYSITEKLANVEPSPDALAEYVRAAAYVVVTLSLGCDRAGSERFLHLTRRIESALPQNETASRGLLRFAETVFQRSFGCDVWANAEIAREGLRLSVLAGDNRNQLFVKAFFGMAMAELGDYDAAQTILREEVALARERNEPLLETHATVMLEQMELESGMTIPLDRLASLGIGEDARINPLLRGQATGNAASALLRLGQISEAESTARRALTALRHAPAYWIHALPTLILSLLRQSRATEASQVAAEGLALCTSFGCGGVSEISVRSAAAEVQYALAKLDDAKEQLRLAQKALSVRAQHIPIPALRERFLRTSPQGRRVDELIRRWTITGDGLL